MHGVLLRFFLSRIAFHAYRARRPAIVEASPFVGDEHMGGCFVLWNTLKKCKEHNGVDAR